MNRTFFLSKEEAKPQWRLIDAKGKVVGRLATQIASILRGKDKAHFTPHTDSGDYVVVINADHIVFTGKKMRDKDYIWYTGYIGGQKKLKAHEVMKKDSSRVLERAVKGMLGSSKLSRAQLKKLKIYAGTEHPHSAQLSSKA